MAVDAIGGFFTSSGIYNPQGSGTVREAARGIWRSNGWDKASSGGGSSYAASSALNKSLFENLGSIRNSAARLRSEVSSMAALSQYSSGINRIAESSDNKVLTAAVAKGTPVSEHTKTNVSVNQLASGQSNKSADLAVDVNSFGSDFSLSITDSKGQTRSFSVALSGADDNKSAMKAMADRINNSAAGVKATVVEDRDKGTVSLRLDSAKTGEQDGKFTVRDDSPAGLAKVEKEAQNAKYSVNDREFSSQSNNVTLVGGVSAELKSTGSSQVSYKRDYGDAVSSVKKFLDEYNKLKDLGKNSGELTGKFNAFESNFRRELSYSGIGRDSEGNLAVTDENKLRESIQSGSFAGSFQGFGSMGNRISEIASDAYSTAYSSAVKDNLNAVAKEQRQQNSDYMASVFRAANVQSGLFLNLLI